MHYKIGDFIFIEELNQISKTSDYTVIDSNKYKGKELKFYQENLQGKIIKHKVLGDIILSRKRLRETNYRVRNKYLSIICFIDKIIETGYSDGHEEPIKHPRTDSILTFYPIYNQVIFDGKLLGITVLIAEDATGKKSSTLIKKY